MKAEGFPKRERIVSQKLIDELFTGGQSHSLAAFPLRAVFLVHDIQGTAHGAPFSILLSVPKRRFKHAVDRNRVKRQLREAFRHQQHLLQAAVPADKQVAIAFVYLADQHFPSSVLADRVHALLQRIARKL